MTEPSARPAVLLGVRVPDEFLQRVALRYAVLGPLPPAGDPVSTPVPELSPQTSTA